MCVYVCPNWNCTPRKSPFSPRLDRSPMHRCAASCPTCHGICKNAALQGPWGPFGEVWLVNGWWKFDERNRAFIHLFMRLANLLIFNTYWLLAFIHLFNPLCHTCFFFKWIIERQIAVCHVPNCQLSNMSDIFWNQIQRTFFSENPEVPTNIQRFVVRLGL